MSTIDTVSAQPIDEALRSVQPDEGRDVGETTEPECKPPPRRRITQAQLRTLLAEHRDWLTAGRPDGKQPDLSCIDFSDCDFSDISSPFPACSSYLISLRQANLQQTVFGPADLQDVDLRDANLECADLGQVRNLLEDQWGGADLRYAQLPASVASFKALDKVNDLSKIASGIFLSMLLSCVYAWLAIRATQDVQLLTNSGSFKLPVIQTDIQVAAFYWDAPAVLLGLYLYFHIYMQRLWEASAKLPAVFPGGETVDMQTYPWLLNDLICRHFVQLNGRKPPLADLQAALCVLLAWWVVPATLLMFWMRYVRRHDFGGTTVHLLMLFGATWAGIQLYRLAAATLDRDDARLRRWRKPLRDPKTYGYAAIAFSLVGLLGFLSYGAFYGLLPDDTPRGGRASSLALATGKAVDLIEEHIYDLPFLDLKEADISSRPSAWTGREADLPMVKGAALSERNLRYAKGYRVFLVRADLQGSNLEYADLREANLWEADLRGADLRGAKLQGANLTDTTLGDYRDSHGVTRHTELTSAQYSHYTTGPARRFDWRAHGALLTK